MKAIMLMFDSLNRRFLPGAGSGAAHAPNFARLNERAVYFETSYVGSLPCMPARRELHTGRHNFLHRGWSPLEPFDQSLPQLLREAGIWSHLVSDHYHYWEEGGANYHCRFTSWEAVRGQEGDPWIPAIAHMRRLASDPEGTRLEWTTVDEPGAPDDARSHLQRQDIVNRRHLEALGTRPQLETIAGGLDFLDRNHDEDDWFLQIETFDPHEPFWADDESLAAYGLDERGASGRALDWPPYAPCESDEQVVDEVRRRYLALVTMCDRQLGRVLDAMDRYGLWEDTMLIVNTDHGYFLGEHGWWAKNRMPDWDELVHTPLWIYDPRCPEAAGTRRTALVQTIDLAPTLLGLFGVEVPAEMSGHDLAATIAEDRPVRAFGLFGYHGSHVNITDGRYVYMRAPADASNTPLNEYTLAPSRMRTSFTPDEMLDVELVDPLPFTRGMPVLRIGCRPGSGQAARHAFGNLLYDLARDPLQQAPLEDAALEARMVNALIEQLEAHDAPEEQYARLGLDGLRATR